MVYEKDKSIIGQIKQACTFVVNQITIDRIAKGYTLITIVWWFLSYFNLMPYYQVKLYPVNSLTPRVNLFPGEPIRLDMDFHDASNKGEIKSVIWKISKSDESFTVEGLSPSIKVPPNDGGTYILETIVTNADNSHRYGVSNFYVVQDKPVPAKLCRATDILINKHNTSPIFLNMANSAGTELYVGGNSWIPLKNEKRVDGTQLLKINSGESVPLYNGQILVRARGSSDKILNYESFPLPPTSFDCEKQKAKKPAA